MARKKVVITCAVTGSVHTPTMSPYLPVTPDQIAAEAIAAAEAGASILHLHARDPENGRPTADPDVFMQFLPRIKQATDAVINITTGGSSLMTLDERLAAPLEGRAGNVLAQHGLDEFCAVPDARQAEGMEARVGAEAARSDARHDLQEHLRRHGDGARKARPRLRHALRIRVLRCRPSLFAGAFPRPRPGVGAAVHPVRVRHSRRHRRRPGKPDPHEAHRRQAVRRRLRILGARRRPSSDADAVDRGGDGRQCPRRAGGFAL